MTERPLSELDRELDLALRALPTPAAPPTLVSRVMQQVAVAEPSRVGGQITPWFAWPIWSQVSAALALFVGVAALVRFAPMARDWWQSLRSTAPLTVTRVLWDAIEPAVAGGSIYVVVMGLVVACVGAALAHVALDGPQRSQP